jgi:hypothetical protein
MLDMVLTDWHGRTPHVPGLCLDARVSSDIASTTAGAHRTLTTVSTMTIASSCAAQRSSATRHALSDLHIFVSLGIVYKYH